MKVYLYVLNTLADWEISFITAELYSKRYFKNGNEEFTLLKVASTNEPIKTMGGLVISPDVSLKEIDDDKSNILILPGADTWFEKENQKIVEIATERIKNGLKIAAICGATGALAKAGALNQIKHTSNAIEFLQMFRPEYTGEAHYINKPAITDGNLITASGLAPLEFAYEVIKAIGVFQQETLGAWYKLYITRETKYFYELLNSVKREDG